jgi:spore coat protein A
MTITRREAIRMGLMGGGSLLLPWGFSSPALASLSPQGDRFQYPFRTPPLLKPVRSDDTFDYYQIAMEKAQVEILPGYKAEVWSYRGAGLASEPLGPIIRQPKLRQSVIRFINKLGTTREDRQEVPIQTSIHLHGMASLPEYDGYAEDLIDPGYYKDYRYPNNRAATLWYHDHALDHTARNVYRGLAGMYIVEHDSSDFFDPEDFGRLPKGAYDVPLIIQDKQFDASKTPDSLVFDNRNQRGFYGDVILVNGVPWPRMKVANRKYRFRVLNASPSRSYLLALSTGDDLTVIASDAALLAEPFPTKTLRLGVAERYELVIDFSQHLNQRVILRNLGLSNNIDADTRTDAIMCFDVDREEKDDSLIPAKLGKVKSIGEILAAKDENLTLADLPVKRFRFDRNNNTWKINNKTWDRKHVEATPGFADIQIWELINPGGGWIHPVHIHLVDLRLLTRNGRTPLAYEQGWKDVFYVGEFETVRVLAQFIPHEGKYMMHCHNLVHEDHSMMTQFKVGQDGLEPDAIQAMPYDETNPPPL